MQLIIQKCVIVIFMNYNIRNMSNDTFQTAESSILKAE